MPRQPRQQRLLQNAVPAVPARAAYAPDTTCRMADRTVKQLCELVVGDCILDAFGRYQVITAVEQVNTDAHFCVEAYYVDGVASVDPVTVCVGPGTSLPLTTTVSPTILKQTRKSGAHYRSLNAFQLSEEQGISTEIAVYRSLPPIYRGIRPDQLEEVMVTVNARCNDLLGRILYHQLYSHEYAAYKQKLPAMIKRVHMRRAPMRGAIDPATWPAGREMPLSWTDLARAVWLDMPEPRPVFAGHDGTNWAADLSYLVFLWLADGSRKMTVIHQKHSELGLQLLTRIRTVAARLRMCVSVTLHPAFHPVTNAPWGHMMRIALKKEAGRGDTIFEKMLQATNLWEAKEYDDVITHMLLVDSEDVRAAAVGGMLDGDGTVYRFEGEVYRYKLGQKAADFVDSGSKILGSRALPRPPTIRFITGSPVITAARSATAPPT